MAIADDQDMIRSGFEPIIDHEPDMRVAGRRRRDRRRVPQPADVVC
ncbi:MAG: hypothetical protein R2705_09415 [Ilumatobacteraceae bacterium]